MSSKHLTDTIARLHTLVPATATTSTPTPTTTLDRIVDCDTLCVNNIAALIATFTAEQCREVVSYIASAIERLSLTHGENTVTKRFPVAVSVMPVTESDFEVGDLDRSARVLRVLRIGRLRGVPLVVARTLADLHYGIRLDMAKRPFLLIAVAPDQVLEGAERRSLIL